MRTTITQVVNETNSLVLRYQIEEYVQAASNYLFCILQLQQQLSSQLLPLITSSSLTDQLQQQFPHPNWVLSFDELEFECEIVTVKSPYNIIIDFNISDGASSIDLAGQCQVFGNINELNNRSSNTEITVRSNDNNNNYTTHTLEPLLLVDQDEE